MVLKIKGGLFMFKFFKRMKTVVGSELNAMLDKAEDPIKMLDQFMREMEEDITDAEGAVAKQIANEKILKRKANDAKAMVEKRQQQAEKAVEAGEDDLARRALEEKVENEKQAALLDESWTRAKSDADEIKDKLEQMKKEYNQMKLKKDALKARAETAKTRAKMNRTMSNIGGDESRKGFERMEEKVLQFEAEAETTEDLTQTSRTLDDEFEKLEGSNVDKELAALKEKMNKK
jgi:phage shock protein A